MDHAVRPRMGLKCRSVKHELSSGGGKRVSTRQGEAHARRRLASMPTHSSGSIVADLTARLTGPLPTVTAPYGRCGGDAGTGGSRADDRDPVSRPSGKGPLTRPAIGPGNPPE